jgi:hypothetical protein
VVHKTFDRSFDSKEKLTYVVCIRPFSHGFYIGSNEGEMAMWLRSDQNPASTGKDPYDCVKKWQPAETKKNQILSLAINVSEEYLAVALDNNSIGLILTKTINMTEHRNTEVKFDLICRGFHTGAITGLDVAV